MRLGSPHDIACAFSLPCIVRRYIGKVLHAVKGDQPAYKMQFHDCKVERYLDYHPEFTEEQSSSYLNHPDVIVLWHTGPDETEAIAEQLLVPQQ